MGGHLNVDTMQFSSEGAHFYDLSVPGAHRSRQEHRYKTTVYNLEVEDFHTYYVGTDGIWVHNKKLTRFGGGDKLPASQIR